MPPIPLTADDWRLKTAWPFSKPSDIWHVGIAHAPIAHFLDASATPPPITWLPLPRSFAFIADPFAHHHDDGSLTVFVEALDYRIKRGEIHYYHYSPTFELLGQGVALAAAYHLSYPLILTHKGETYMLPEAHRTGKLTLHRATDFPTGWQPIADLLPLPAIDASPIVHNGKWWMFFSLPGENLRPLRELHLAYADDLFGPWTLHAANPVRTGLNGSRMGGTPFIHAGELYVPMQDCSTTYGGAITMLKVTTLSTTAFAAEQVRHITPEAFHPSFSDGMHTLSACGDITLLDVKRTLHSPIRRFIDTKRRLRRLLKNGAPL